jgi:hypothetical protein
MGTLNKTSNEVNKRTFAFSTNEKEVAENGRSHGPFKVSFIHRLSSV